MATRKSVLVMSKQDQGDFSYNVSDKVRTDSYFGYTDGLQTLSVHVNNYTGGIKIQGTLSLNPTESDWFDINVPDADSDKILKFPQNPANPTGDTGDTGVVAFNITGNFTYIRAVMTRQYIEPEPNPLANLGYIDKVLLAY